MNANRVTRRGFLRSAAAGAAAGAVLPTIVPSSVFGADAPSNRVGFAQIGCGGRGGGVMGGFHRQKDVQCVAACDPFKSRREGTARRLGAKPYKDFREVLALKDVDAVLIATPDHWHVPIAIAAAKAGKDMYVEKPLGITIEEDKACRAAIKRYGRIFQYGTQQRSSGHCRFGCELVRNGRIGKIHTIEVDAPAGRGGGSTKEIPVPDGFDYNLWLGPAPVSPYTKDRCTSSGTYFVYDNSIGFLGGWGAHPLDILVWGADIHNRGPVEIEGTGVIPTKGLFNTVTTWSVKCTFADGLKLIFKHGGDRTRFIGPDGWVQIRRGGISAGDPKLLKSAIKPDETHLVKSPGHCRNFVDSVKSRKPAVSTIDHAVWSNAISLLSDIAIRTRRKIKWDPKKETIVGDAQAAAMMKRAMRPPWHL